MSELKMRISVLICAYNEVGNIENIINDIFNQQEVGWVLDKIIVVSDASSDGTDEKVNGLSHNDSRIIFLRLDKRSGKAECFNLGKRGEESDAILSVDADVRIRETDVISNLVVNLNSDIGLVGGNPVPQKSGNSFALLSSKMSYYLREVITNNMPESVYGAHGRLLLVARGLYKNMELQNSPGTDQYMFFSCKKQGLKFIFINFAKVYYEAPKKIKDYIRQNLRMDKAVQNMRKYFGDKFVDESFRIPLRIKIKMVIELLKHPFCFVSWFCLFTYSFFIKRVLNNNESVLWQVAHSTKVNKYG